MFSIVVPVMNEEKRILHLLRTIVSQTHRPIEIIVVNGGSTDSTHEIVTGFAGELNRHDFILRLVDEKASRPHGGNVSSARNLGVRACNGENILMLDADFVLADNGILAQLGNALRENEIAFFETVALVDSWLEHQAWLDAEKPLLSNNSVGGWAFRKWILDRYKFDESLAFGEDMDLLQRLSEANLLHSARVAATGFKHFPENLKEVRRQKLWYGRTAIMWVRKHHSLRELLVLSPLAVLGLFFLQFIGYAYSTSIGLTATAVFLVPPAILLCMSGEKNLQRLVYLIFVRTIYGAFFFSVGFIGGVLELLLRGHIRMSRE